jgi:5-carboxymethyl-2-hydroxymuconate isomerase
MMPQILLECSDNIVEKSFTELLSDIHQLLAEKLPTQIAGCKSRVLRHQDYAIGDLAINNAFVHLSISVLKGRSQTLLNEIANTLMDKLTTYFQASLKQRTLQITIAMQELPDIYLKYTP